MAAAILVPVTGLDLDDTVGEIHQVAHGLALARQGFSGRNRAELGVVEQSPDCPAFDTRRHAGCEVTALLAEAMVVPRGLRSVGGNGILDAFTPVRLQRR